MKYWAINCLLFCLSLSLLLSCKEEKEVISIKIDCKNSQLYGFNLDFFNIIQDTIQKDETFGDILDRHHVIYPKINQIVNTIKDTFDIRKIRVGKPYTILTSKDSLQEAKIFIYHHNLIDKTIVDFQDSIITAKKHKEEIKIIERKVGGEIIDNLSFAMENLGLRPNLTYEIADNIYAWTLDFQKLQKGDKFRFVFEEKYINDTIFAGYGKVKSAVFTHKNEDLYAFRFVTDSVKGVEEYYDEKGKMLRSQFLKSPIKFQYRISSRYNLRRRIALYGNKVRPHKGTDFAAAIGTPIMSTANGTVIESARRGGNGNYVKIRHNNTYTTQYLHMRKRKAKVGDYVKQGDVIGWVGMTGNTSGPHVCYRFWKNGKQVDPFKQKLPSAKPLQEDLKPIFFKYISPLKTQLKEIKIVEKDTIKSL